jgi:hypothetical protein
MSHKKAIFKGFNPAQAFMNDEHDNGDTCYSAIISITNSIMDIIHYASNECEENVH